MKVFKKRLTKDLNLHKHFFSQKVVDNWNSPHNQCQDSQPIQDQLRQLPERKWIWGFRRHFKPTLIPSNLKCKCKCNHQIQCSIAVLTSRKSDKQKKEKKKQLGALLFLLLLMYTPPSRRPVSTDKGVSSMNKKSRK